MIVIHGPVRTGKTLHARRFAQHYGCTRILDIPAFSTVRALRKSIWDGTIARNPHVVVLPGVGTRPLFLATEDADYLRRHLPPETKLISIVDARKDAGLEPIPEGGFPIETTKPAAAVKDHRGDLIDRIAARLAAADGLHWAEVCGYEAIPPLSNCDSSTCVAAHFEDHDAYYAREQYRKYARIAFDAGEIPDDVRRLVIAARCVLQSRLALDDEARELDKAVEAFASRVDYDDQQERFDFDIDNDGVMTALPTWKRDDRGTYLRLMLVHGLATTQADIASWTDEQCQQADIWACTTHLSASDHDDIKVPPRPDFLRPGNHAAGRHPITGETL